MKIKVPKYWTPEQATAVFEFVDDIREAILVQYQLQIMQYMRDERCVEFDPEQHSNIIIDDEELPF